MGTTSPFILLLVSIISVAASSGFWAYIMHRGDRKSAQTRLLLGISHMLIVQAGTQYKQRGWITNDEYEEFHRYLYTPYAQQGGNGLAARIMDEVKNLPMVKDHTHGEQRQSVPIRIKEKDRGYRE